mgnify:CR=1 FL=1
MLWGRRLIFHEDDEAIPFFLPLAAEMLFGSLAPSTMKHAEDKKRNEACGKNRKQKFQFSHWQPFHWKIPILPMNPQLAILAFKPIFDNLLYWGSIPQRESTFG